MLLCHNSNHSFYKKGSSKNGRQKTIIEGKEEGFIKSVRLFSNHISFNPCEHLEGFIISTSQMRKGKVNQRAPSTSQLGSAEGGQNRVCFNLKSMLFPCTMKLRQSSWKYSIWKENLCPAQKKVWRTSLTGEDRNWKLKTHTRNSMVVQHPFPTSFPPSSSAEEWSVCVCDYCFPLFSRPSTFASIVSSVLTSTYSISFPQNFLQGEYYGLHEKISEGKWFGQGQCQQMEHLGTRFSLICLWSIFLLTVFSNSNVCRNHSGSR